MYGGCGQWRRKVVRPVRKVLAKSTQCSTPDTERVAFREGMRCNRLAGDTRGTGHAAGESSVTADPCAPSGVSPVLRTAVHGGADADRWRGAHGPAPRA